MYFVCYTCTEKLRLSSWSCQLSSWSCQNVLSVCTTLVLKSCDFRAGAGSVLRILHLYGKVAFFELELPEHCKPMQRKGIRIQGLSAGFFQPK